MLYINTENGLVKSYKGEKMVASRIKVVAVEVVILYILKGEPRVSAIRLDVNVKKKIKKTKLSPIQLERELPFTE